MTNETKPCLVCGQPKSTSLVGSLTQWISICQCDLVVPETAQDDNVAICATCGKRIPESDTGSFTQWVFRSQLCECKAPVPLDALNAEDQSPLPPVLQGDKPIDAPATGCLRLSRDTFPIDRYKPIKELGAGADGTVYLCWDEHLPRYVSVKVLRNRSNAKLVAFQQEAKVSARFVHPNVVSIIDFGVTEGGIPFMVLEYIDGITLDAIIKTEGSVPQNVAVNLFIQIADALEHGHASGIFHRDIKSSNIMVTEQSTSNDSIRIIDFGVASLLTDDKNSAALDKNIVGTPEYMPPDQANGKPYDARSEVYSFGCVMFETLVGKLPFEADTAIDLLSMHANNEPPTFADCNEDIVVSADLEEIVQRCLSKDPDDRYQTMKSLRQALQECRLDLVNTADVQKPDEQEHPVTKNSTNWIVIAAVLSTLSLLTVELLKKVQMESKHEESHTTRVKKKEKLEKFRAKNFVDLDEHLDSRKVKFKFEPISPGFYVAKAMEYVADSDLATLQNRKDVVGVDLDGCEIEGPGLAYLVNLPMLGILNLNRTPIDDSALEYVQRMKLLHSLFLQRCQVSNASLEKLEDLPIRHLTCLNPSPETFVSFSPVKIKTLEGIDVQNMPNFDARTVGVLLQAPRLTTLRVSNSNDALLFKNLSLLKNTEIVIGRSVSTDPGANLALSNLALLSNKSLGFIFINIKAPHIKLLKQKNSLRSLSVTSAPINDEILADIADMPLTNLYISTCLITDKGVQLLAKNRKLKTLTIQNCPGVTPEGKAKLRKAMPRTLIN